MGTYQTNCLACTQGRSSSRAVPSVRTDSPVCFSGIQPRPKAIELTTVWHRRQNANRTSLSRCGHSQQRVKICSLELRRPLRGRERIEARTRLSLTLRTCLRPPHGNFNGADVTRPRKMMARSSRPARQSGSSAQSARSVYNIQR